MKKGKEVDPITVEVIGNYLRSVTTQMGSNLVRAAFTPVMTEMRDFSCAIFTREHELVAERSGLPIFTGTLDIVGRTLVNYVGKDNIDEGDVILCTYPYMHGSHAQDVTLMKPIFVDKEIFFYAMVKGHWIDLGGKAIYISDSTSMWVEGLKLRASKIRKRGVLNDELVEIIRANSRLPDDVIGDMTAQLSTLDLGERGIFELINKYGKDVVEGAMERMLAHGEETTRRAIAEMPDGEWSADGVLDNNGVDDYPVPVHVTVRIKGDKMTVDTTGTAPQQPGPVNCLYPTTLSLARLMLKLLTTPGYPYNGGCFRPLEVIVPEGSLLHPVPPAPCFLYVWGGQVMSDCMLKALAEVIPERAVCRCGSGISCYLSLGTDPRDGSLFHGTKMEACGEGASIDADGESALSEYLCGGVYDVPSEIQEATSHVLIERYELRQDSGGPGKFRGGLGIEIVYKAEVAQEITLILEMSKSPAWGLFGGKSGLPNAGITNPGTSKEKQHFKVTAYLIDKGEKWIVLGGGGGGWGDPYERETKAVLRDVISGYVSLGSALKDYGVVIKKEDDEYILDEVETEKLRKQKGQKNNC